MKSFVQYLKEAGGKEAGTMELVRTSLDKAREYAEKVFKEHGKDLDKEIPDFDKHYEYAKSHASGGKTKRKDMPVIAQKDVRDFQMRLKEGYIDLKAPFSKSTKPTNPFPEGLSGEDAKQWLEQGLEVHDGNKNDDKVSATMTRIKVGKLRPIQQQIYFDNPIPKIAKDGAKAAKEFLTDSRTVFIVSSDNFIIDGHHRFLTGMLIDPDIMVNALAIDLPISKLLPLAIAYSDAVGNKRNL